MWPLAGSRAQSVGSAALPGEYSGSAPATYLLFIFNALQSIAALSSAAAQKSRIFPTMLFMQRQEAGVLTV